MIHPSPLATPARPAAPVRAPGREPRTGSADRPLVLVVDDIANNLLALEGLLRRHDLEIATASSASAALEILLERDVALAIVDVHMPEMDGFELAEAMRGVERTRHVPIIFVTAAPPSASRVFDGYEVGAVDFLFKPIDPHVLRSKVDVFVTLDRQRRELQRIERLRELFVATLGHDLRNPLGAIRMTAELALETHADVQRRPLQRIVRIADRSLRMIEQLLDVSRIRLAGGVPLAPAPADLRAIVTQIVAEFDHADRITVEVTGDLEGVWDADRLSQVVSNLIGNALAHGANATPIAIRVDGMHGPRVELSVHNFGPAIPAHLRDCLFDPFRARERTKGLGIGLFVCKHFVEAHGGWIEHASSDDAGTTFRISLPRQVPSPS